MAITITPEYDVESWNALVGRSDQTNPLHRYEALAVLEKHADARLHPLVGYNGEEPIGLFPVFETHRGPFTTVSSPPSFVDTLQLGPALLGTEGMKRRRVERVTRDFVDEALAWVDQLVDPDQVHIRTDPRFGDLRPFSWADYEVRPYYTYAVDIGQDDETLLSEFSRDARRNVRQGDETEYEITVGDRDDLEAIVDQVIARHREQDDPLRIPKGVFLDLHDALPEGVMRPYVCRLDGGFTSGVVTLEQGDIIYRWKGGAKTDVDLASSDVLDWHIMRDARSRDIRYYDLVGANMPRLCEYKAKFGPDTWTYYVAERRTPMMEAAVSTQRLAQQVTTRARQYME